MPLGGPPPTRTLFVPLFLLCALTVEPLTASPFLQIIFNRRVQCIFTGGNPSRFSATFRALSRYLQRPFNRLSDCQIRYHAARRYGRPAAERLKLDVRENPVFHLDLNLHEVPAHRVSAIPLGRPLLVIGARFIITGIKAAFR